MKPQVQQLLLTAMLLPLSACSNSQDSGDDSLDSGKGGVTTSAAATSSGTTAKNDSSSGSGGTNSLGGSSSSGSSDSVAAATTAGDTTSTNAGGAANASSATTDSGTTAATDAGGATSSADQTATETSTSTTGAPTAGCLTFGEPQEVGELENTELNGPSGMVRSRANAGVYYAHLDAGGPATVFALARDGRDLGSFVLDGLEQTDFEDIATGPGPDSNDHVFVGDIGDNAAREGGTARDEIQVFRFAEPSLTTDTAASETVVSDYAVLRFTYPEEPHDAETLMVDPITGDILILTKENSGPSSLFRAPSNSPANTSTQLELVTSVDVGTDQATAGDTSPAGDRFIVRTYSSILLWPRADSLATTFAASANELPSPTQPQGEGLTFSGDGNAWLSSGERELVIYEGLSSCP